MRPWARRVVSESGGKGDVTFMVYDGAEGDLRTDHTLPMYGYGIAHLHYRMEPKM